jgi:hypothetical protein
MADLLLLTGLADGIYGENRSLNNGFTPSADGQS